MWEKLRSPLLYLSLGMNLAFLIVLGFLYVPKAWGPKEFHNGKKPHRYHHDKRKKHGKKDPGWYFYRHKIGVSDTQWTKLRPDMEQFHKKALKLCRRIRELRNEMLRLIEDPNAHEKAIRQHEEKILSLKKTKQRLFVDYMTRKKQYLNSGQERAFFSMLRRGRDCDKHTRFLEQSNHHKQD